MERGSNWCHYRDSWEGSGVLQKCNKSTHSFKLGKYSYFLQLKGLYTFEKANRFFWGGELLFLCFLFFFFENKDYFIWFFKKLFTQIIQVHIYRVFFCNGSYLALRMGFY